MEGVKRDMRKNILVYNNTTGIVELIPPLFDQEELNVIAAPTLEALLMLMKSEHIHMILVDIELDASGWGHGMETIHYIRKNVGIPFIVISSQTAETAKIMALNVGADDYVTIYDNPYVLLARVKALLRRYSNFRINDREKENVYRLGDLELNDKLHTVVLGGNEVKMTPIEYKILRLLMQEKGKVFSMKQIYEKIWQMQALDSENVVAVHIRHLRQKIERNPRDPQYLKAVRGLGYKVG